jgi:hypothetical protein
LECNATGNANGKPTQRCPECASTQIIEIDQYRGEAWQCGECACYWGYVDGAGGAYDFHHTGEEVRQLMAAGEDVTHRHNPEYARRRE